MRAGAQVHIGPDGKRYINLPVGTSGSRPKMRHIVIGSNWGV
jgi:hypothetical protein